MMSMRDVQLEPEAICRGLTTDKGEWCAISDKGVKVDKCAIQQLRPMIEVDKGERENRNSKGQVAA